MAPAAASGRSINPSGWDGWMRTSLSPRLGSGRERESEAEVVVVVRCGRGTLGVFGSGVGWVTCGAEFFFFFPSYFRRMRQRER